MRVHILSLALVPPRLSPLLPVPCTLLTSGCCAVEAELNADKAFIATLKKHIEASKQLSPAEKAQLQSELNAEEADVERLEGELKEEQVRESLLLLCWLELC